MRSGEKELARIAPMKEPRRELKEQLDSYSLQKPSVPKEGKPKEEKPKEEKPKKKVSLTLEELERQSQLIEGYLGSGNLSASAILLREWMISTVIFHSGNTKDWLNRDTRLELAERKLGALSRWTEDESLKEALTAQQKELVGLWQGVSERRNDLAHAGMNEDMTKFQPAPFRRAFDKLRTKLGDASFWSVETADKTDDVWLISPLGTTPGALFTAIKRAESDQLLIVTSEQGKRLAPEVLREAEREDLSPHFALLDDPFNGFSEVRGLTGSLRKEHGLDWIRAGEIVVNLTGGTTCLGWAVAQLENNLKRMSLNPRTVACIDRRTPEEQKRNPYREGEMQDIEPDEEKGNE